LHWEFVFLLQKFVFRIVLLNLKTGGWKKVIRMVEIPCNLPPLIVQLMCRQLKVFA